LCGITGFFSNDHEIDTDLFYPSHNLLKHRGPDDEGFVFQDSTYKLNLSFGKRTINKNKNLKPIESVSKARLIMGHHRLSIVDLSFHGHQPFLSHDNNYALVYNGEIYNHIELRSELIQLGYVFKSNSDSEVVLYSLIHWGTDALSKFNGMWAFAFYDKIKDKLLLCRDRFGIKPLFFSYINNVLYFSSEMRFIRTFAQTSNTVNPNVVESYLQSSTIFQNSSTIWNDIFEVRPGRYLEFQEGKYNEQVYWSPQFPQKYISKIDDALDEFRFLFDDSLRLRMRSDVEVGSLLSGGLDSNLIVGRLFQLGLLDKNYKSFSAVFQEEEYSEKRYIDESVNKYGIIPNEVMYTPESVFEYFDELIETIEVPFRSLSILSQYLLYKRINEKTNVKVVLNGQGADEMFAGYTRHYPYIIAHSMQKLDINQLAKELITLKRYRSISKKDALLRGLQILRYFKDHKTNFNELLSKDIISHPLREYLSYDDRNSMAFGIEARVPFLDYRLVEYSFRLNPNLKIRNGINKFIPREFSKNIVPYSIYDRKDKMGFVSPQETWQRTLMKDFMQNDLKRSNLEFLEKYIDVPYTITLYEDYLSRGKGSWSFFWRLFNLVRWQKKYSASFC